MSVNKFQVVCSTCSANKAPLKYRNLSTARVCDTCYDIIESGKQRKFLILLSVQFQVKTIEKNKFVLKPRIAVLSYIFTELSKDGALASRFHKRDPSLVRQERYVPGRLRESARGEGAQVYDFEP